MIKRVAGLQFHNTKKTIQLLPNVKPGKHFRALLCRGMLLIKGILKCFTAAGKLRNAHLKNSFFPFK